MLIWFIVICWYMCVCVRTWVRARTHFCAISVVTFIRIRILGDNIQLKFYLLFLFNKLVIKSCVEDIFKFDHIGRTKLINKSTKADIKIMLLPKWMAVIASVRANGLNNTLYGNLTISFSRQQVLQQVTIVVGWICERTLFIFFLLRFFNYFFSFVFIYKYWVKW